MNEAVLAQLAVRSSLLLVEGSKKVNLKKDAVCHLRSLIWKIEKEIRAINKYQIILSYFNANTLFSKTNIMTMAKF